jgi:hypothetical protein
MQSNVDDKDHIDIDIVKSISNVPIYQTKDIYKYHNVFVSIRICEYICGKTLASIIKDLDKYALGIIIYNPYTIPDKLVLIKSEYFGYIQNSLKCISSPIVYLYIRIMEAEILGRLDSNKNIEAESDM